MNCPSCDKPPSSITHNLKMSGVGFKKALEGYTKCQHCGQVLKQKRYYNFIAAYEKPFYWYALILFGFFGGLLFFAVNYFETNFSPSETSSLLTALLFFPIVMLGFLLPYLALILKFSIYEISSEEELNTEYEPENKYQLMFINFFILALAGGALIFYLLSNFVINFFIFLGVLVVYLGVVMGIGFNIMRKSRLNAESGKNKPESSTN